MSFCVSHKEPPEKEKDDKKKFLVQKAHKLCDVSLI